ncbi:Alpha/Beta hydrolase protein [Tricladium varicosporioides]|nr:Alpha/Beta hydrolase protein [Hymenoscyphus varicosporioides]
MSSHQVIDWNTGTKSAMISIGTHSLYLSTSGQERKSGAPAVLLMQGMGSLVDEWVVVRRLVTPFARWIEYDRSGLGKSEAPPKFQDKITAVDVARELDILLKNSGIEGPFIIVCHSWGGITSREFLHLRPDDIAGMVFVDANTENMHASVKWPLPAINAVIGNCTWLRWMQVTGLVLSHKLRGEEWKAVVEGMEDLEHEKVEESEARGFQADLPVLAAKKQFEKQALGHRPVSVIRGNSPRDFQMMYDAGVAAGNGTEAEKKLAKEYIGSWGPKDHQWQEEILRLSTFGRMVSVSTSGHNVQMVEPEVIAEEIRWVYEQVV